MVVVVGAADGCRRGLELSALGGEVLDGLHALWGPCGGDGGRCGRGARGLLAVAITREVCGLRVFLRLVEAAHENVSGVNGVLAGAAGRGCWIAGG